MNLDIALQILQLAILLVRGQFIDGAQSNATLALTLTNIVQIAAQAYYKQLGQPIDPLLIKPETAI